MIISGRLFYGKENQPLDRFRISRVVFLCLAWGLVGSILIQTFLAGMAVFTDPVHWSKHAAFVHLFEYLPILMLLFAFTGRMPISLRWLSAGLLGLIFVQYATANLAGAAAIHPVIALVMFWVALVTAQRARL